VKVDFSRITIDKPTNALYNGGMAEKYTSKRVLFPKGSQETFLKQVLATISTQEAAKLCNLSERTIRDWRREKFSMDFASLSKICKRIGIPLPKEVTFEERYWYAKKGAQAGGLARYKKYGNVGGDEKYRKKKWFEWWERKGKYSFHPILNAPKKIRRPRPSEELAEFVGIVLGDGGISRYQVTVTLHSEDDKEYGKFVVSLIKKLFAVPVGVYPSKRDKAIDYVVSRIDLVRFLEKIGLQQGNKIKHQVDIPGWIKNNKRYFIACARGLVDTDGSVFTHRYKVNGKWYSYKKLGFTSLSRPMLYSIYKLFNELGLHARIAGNKDVRLDSIESMKSYFTVIGSHNPKHLKRYQN